ncbi:coiled-coil domain-containing protein 170 isoform X2 [Spea bombifrons]|uniref:coiled-coil domain-containing protein 170 isoform X2 n=1 Tax=Spea bombifrons TaxID=233779 RepID=UPI00234A1575|nr:coiled-coil domain-containing protein 170 isoform X2 [Spea bombifrons]
MSTSSLNLDADHSSLPSFPRADAAHAQEQFNLYRRNMDIMDDLSSTRNAGRSRSRRDLLKSAYDPLLLDIPVTREQVNHYRTIAENAHSELAALQVKFETAQSELFDLRSRLSSRDVSLQELKSEVENYKENNARQASIITSLRGRMQESEEQSGLLATSKTRADLAMQATLQENQDLKEKIQDLESRIKTYLTQWEDSKSQVSRYSRSHGHFLAELSACLDFDIKGKDDSEELLISKVVGLCKDNAELKGRVATLEETNNVHDAESRASRETIMRLVKEVSREQKKVSSLTQQMDVLHKDLESATDAKHSLEREIKLLQDRLNASQRAFEASKQELNQAKKSSAELDITLKSRAGEAKAAHSLFESFKEEVAAVLSRESTTVKPKKEAILEKLQDLVNRIESKNMMVAQLESKVCKLHEQLQNQADLHQEALHRAKKAEQHLEDLRGRLKLAEGELVSGDVMRDTLSSDKQKYMKFLELLSDKMKVERVMADVGFDMRLDAILARANQLVKLESDTVIENKTLAHGLQRKLKAQKEQIDSKEIHMELLRKKIAQLEEEKQVRTALAVERDEANMTVRRLQKKVERLQKELNTALGSNTELKARLSDTNELKIKTLEQHKTIEELSKSLDHIEKLKGKTQKKLISLKSELDFTEQEAKEEKERAGNMFEVVTSELKTLKKTLEEVSKREKQLVDFREVVSRMLGLNVNVLALPDYEIIKRLEGLIHTHRHHVVSCA